MNSSLGYITTLLSLFQSVSAIPTAQAPNKFNWSAKKGIIAFGDSYTYVQGTHGHQNYSFIGDQFNYAYDPETLLSNMIVQNQTATAEGGPNWIEYLTNCGLEPGMTSPRSCQKQLWDFAFAGADISTEYTPLHHNFTVSLVNQITQFQEYGHSTLSQHLRETETLIAIWIGINDIGDSSKYAVDFPTFYANLTNTLFTSIDTLYKLGYKSYLLINLPPLDRTPSNQATSTPHPNATQVTWYNDALAAHAEQFGKKRNVEMRVFDAHGRLSEIMESPGRYGIVNTTGYCAGYDQLDVGVNYKEYGCPVPVEEYFWFNSGHLTSHVHRILAGEIERWLMR
ncbi:hypothetical protein N7448_001584 [Penicillium atrosanguineum]|nr:hypothetical protein N7448_001584 [Penicillium atrosanguineum]